VSPPLPSTSRPSVIQFAIQEKSALYLAYIPFFSNGGIFIPSERHYRLGDDVQVLLSLPGDTQHYPVTGQVAWVTPAQASNNRTQGIGVCFPPGNKSSVLKLKIEEILSTMPASDRPTQTI
jgi:type IV pilus assembly protein PilZ